MAFSTMADLHHIKVTKTARYFTLGKLDATTKEVWFVLHGYAQLASTFIQDFHSLDNDNRFIIAPEGLNRFYAKGFGGKPAASWMTSEDREAEIEDYMNYLQQLYHSFSFSPQTRIVVLGFSQGVATASRFIHANQCKVDEFVIYAGEIAAELANPLSPILASKKITYITGKSDPFITPEKHQMVYALMQQLQANIIEFNGGHEINQEALQQIIRTTKI